MTPIRDATKIRWPAHLWLTSQDQQAEMEIGEIASEEALSAALAEAELNGCQLIGWHVNGRDAVGDRISLHEIES